MPSGGRAILDAHLTRNPVRFVDGIGGDAARARHVHHLVRRRRRHVDAGADVRHEEEFRDHAVARRADRHDEAGQLHVDVREILVHGRGLLLHGRRPAFAQRAVHGRGRGGAVVRALVFRQQLPPVELHHFARLLLGAPASAPFAAAAVPASFWRRPACVAGSASPGPAPLAASRAAGLAGGRRRPPRLRC